MSRRIDIELTSTREDGTWTWRAAGAKQPKGVVAAGLLPAGAQLGQVMRAEVETTLDGTEVLGVSPPKAKKDSPGERIELIGRTIDDDQLVTTTLAKRGRGDRGERGDRGDRKGRGERGDRGDRKPRGEGDRRPRPDGDRPRGDGDRRPRPDGSRTADRRGRGTGGGPREGGGPDRPRRDRPAAPARPKAKRLRAGRTHRKAAVAALSAEEQVIAEQVLRGGLPGVRQAVLKQNEQAKAEGRPEVKADALLTVAERLLPALRVAEWRDRADAAVADLEELDLRDLRSVVVAAEQAARDDETRALADQIRAGLARRVEAEQAAWLAELHEVLAEGRVVRALRLSSRPPKAGAPIPGDLAGRLADAAGGALTAETVPDRWATVLDALSFSPVRLNVTPASRPDSPSEELVAVVTKFASRLPRVAESFGIAPPPENSKRRPRPPAPKADGPRPPRPPLQEAPPSDPGTDTDTDIDSDSGTDSGTDSGIDTGTGTGTGTDIDTGAGSPVADAPPAPIEPEGTASDAAAAPDAEPAEPSPAPASDDAGPAATAEDIAETD